MSIVASTVLPFTASGPSAIFPALPAHPERDRTHELTTATRLARDFAARVTMPILLYVCRVGPAGDPENPNWAPSHRRARPKRRRDRLPDAGSVPTSLPRDRRHR